MPPRCEDIKKRFRPSGPLGIREFFMPIPNHKGMSTIFRDITIPVGWNDDQSRIQKQPMSIAASAFEKLSSERLRERAGETVSVAFTRLQLRGILTALERKEERGTHLDPALGVLREMLRRSLQGMPY
jgi:hypothetical protein